MKKMLILGTLIVILILYNCKNKETQSKEIDVPEKTYTEVLQETDTTVQVSPFGEEIVKNESKVQSQTTTKNEVSKTIPTPVKVENSTKADTEPILEKKTEVVINTPVETKTEPKTEVIINTPIETKTEPIVTETPKTVNLNDWKVPSKYVTMENPVPANQDLSIGKSLYDKNCKSCHGKEGFGDGSKAADLKGDLGDFSSAKFQKQTDGELFYKTTFGRDDMPEFTKKIVDDEDRWLIVNYMRTLKE